MDKGPAVQADLSLFETAACGLLVTHPNGLIVRANRTLCDWIGREAAELVGVATMQSLLTMGGRIFHQIHLAPLIQIQGSVSEVKLEVVHQDGRRIPMLWNAVRRVKDGAVTHNLAVFIAEDRHKYERELMLARQNAEAALLKEQEAQRELRVAQAELDRLRVVAEDRVLFAEQMTAVVCHDLCNPLSVINLSASLIGRWGGLSDRQQRSLVQLKSSTDRAIRLIANLLDFSQARMGGGMRVDLTDVDLQALVAASVEGLRVAYPKAVLQHVEVGNGPCRASADKLAQLIGNLVSNAATYGTPGRPIVIRSEVTADAFSVSVSNEGTAIPGHQLPTLFNAMARGGEEESAVHSLSPGLFIVCEIAKAHGGDATVRSGADETTFTATFPRGVAYSGQAAAQDVESQRQRELDRLAISVAQDSAYDDIVKLAADAFDVPVALISLVDGNRQWFKARVGLQASEAPRGHAFCAHAIQTSGSSMQVSDATADPRFANNPLVTGESNIRFYAGAPLLTSNGHALGTLCLIDSKPRVLEPKQLETLQYMAKQVVTMVEHRAQGVLRKPAAD